MNTNDIRTHYSKGLYGSPSSFESDGPDDLIVDGNGNFMSREIINTTNSRGCVTEKLKLICNQKILFPFENVIPNQLAVKLIKLSEGTYSEVFSVNNKGEKITYKIVPVGQRAGRSRVKQDHDSVLADVTIAKRLTDLGKVYSAQNYCSNFVNVKKVSYVQSTFDYLIKLRDRKQMYNKSRSPYHYIVYEMTDGGTPLTNYEMLSPIQGLSIIGQILSSLSIAENSIKFEHRDLHTSNILISKTKEKVTKYKIKGNEFFIVLNGVKVTIIDYTFARATVFGDMVVHSDLSNLNLDDMPDSSLTSVYKKQRELVNKDWKDFNPKSNIYWLSYLLDQIVKRVDKWKRKSSDNRSTAWEESISILYSWKKTINNYDSACKFAVAAKLFELSLK